MSNIPSELNLKDAVSYHYECFPPNQLDYKKIMSHVAKATDCISRFDQMLKKMHNNEIFLTPLINQEAIISSRMEGTISTMDEILKYETDYQENQKENNNIRNDVIETILYRRSLKTAQESLEKGQPLSQHLIKAIHQQLLSFGRGERQSPGNYKVEQNYIAGRIKKNILFIPINPEKLIDGLEKLFEYIDEKNDVPLIKTAITHIEFEALHPFKDGNGRIGRMLIPLMLYKYGIISAPHFYISAFFEENKDAYIDMMRNVSKNNDWTSWCIFFLEAIEKQAIRNLEISEEISSLYEEMKRIFSEVLSSKYSIQALDYIFTNPVFRNNKFSTKTNIPNSTVARFTRILLEKKILTILEKPSGRKPALLSFKPLMELVRV